VSWIPVVDVSSPGAAASIGSACADVGFFSIVGHSIDPKLVAGVWDTARAFFDLPDADKNQVAMPYAGYPYGYAPVAYEALSYSLGDVTPPDLKESFAIGRVDPPSHRFSDPDEMSAWSPNLWPPAPADMRATWEQYFRAMSALAARLLSLMAEALDLAPDYFEPMIDRHTSSVRALNYPVVDEALLPGQQRAGAHTDYGTLTILLADPKVPGLEVQRPDGGWVGVEPPPGGFVVNLGDAMERWTNDRWRSTLHRVVPATERRQSIAFFHSANWDAVIDCLPTCRPAFGEPKYPPIASGPHLMSKFRSSVSRGDDGR
jgi:isopenicillin N synthase-like dioxygenase